MKDEDEDSASEDSEDHGDSAHRQDKDEKSSMKEAVIHAFSAHSAQIKVLDIELQHSSELDNILCALSCRFASLQCLSIQVVENRYDEYDSNILEAFKKSPSLTELRLTHIEMERPCRHSKFPWHQLQLFEHEHFLSQEDMAPILRRCPRLQKYISSNSYYDETAFFVDTSSAVHHTELTHLELFNQPLSLLRYTTIPSLTFLRVSDADDSELTDLAQFISRSQCSIQDLEFSPFETTLPYNFLLESLPSLGRLTLVLNSITQLSEFQSAFTSERLPRLVELSIWVKYSQNPLAMCTPQLMASLIHLIQSRSSRLHSFTFYPEWLGFHFAAFKANESERKDLDMLRALLVPYSEKLTSWIQGGMRLHLFFGAFPRFDLHVYVVQ
jgi:hypothetical protein